MPSTDRELRTIQKSQLHGLLRAKAEADEHGIPLKVLTELINNLESTMDKEDFAWVEKTVASLNAKQ